MGNQSSQPADALNAADENDEFEWVEETKVVPEEIVEEVPREYVQEKYVTTTKMLPTVKAKYPFEGQGMNMAKGEVRANWGLQLLSLYSEKLTQKTR